MSSRRFPHSRAQTRGFEVCLVNAQHVKNVPGQKSVSTANVPSCLLSYLAPGLDVTLPPLQSGSEEAFRNSEKLVSTYGPIPLTGRKNCLISVASPFRRIRSHSSTPVDLMNNPRDARRCLVKDATLQLVRATVSSNKTAAHPTIKASDHLPRIVCLWAPDVLNS